MRARESQERGIVGLGRCGCDDVAEADVNLNGNLCALEIRNEGHLDAFVVGILGALGASWTPNFFLQRAVLRTLP